MNKENFLKIAQHIEDNPACFNLEFYVREGSCGTVACIAGWAYIKSKQEKGLLWTYGGGDSVEDEAEEYLGITQEEGSRLFHGSEGSVWIDYAETYGVPTSVDWNCGRYITDYSLVPSEMAVEVLRDIAYGVTKLSNQGWNNE